MKIPVLIEPVRTTVSRVRVSAPSRLGIGVATFVNYRLELSFIAGTVVQEVGGLNRREPPRSRSFRQTAFSPIRMCGYAEPETLPGPAPGTT